MGSHKQTQHTVKPSDIFSARSALGQSSNCHRPQNLRSCCH